MIQHDYFYLSGKKTGKPGNVMEFDIDCYQENVRKVTMSPEVRGNRMLHGMVDSLNFVVKPLPLFLIVLVFVTVK